MYQQNTEQHTPQKLPYGPVRPDDIKPIKLSNNPKRAMQEMMDTIDHLRQVYELETSALKRSDVKAFMALQDEKIMAAYNYQTGMAQMIHRKDEIKNAEPDIREQLQEMQNEFAQLASRNKDALERMQRSVERLNGTLRSAAKDAIKKERAFSYNSLGSVNSDDTRPISTGSISETA